MTRRDLEEAILNLEYLVLHDFDGTKTREFEKQLEVLRLELQVLHEKQQSLAAAPLSGHQHRLRH